MEMGGGGKDKKIKKSAFYSRLNFLINPKQSGSDNLCNRKTND
jgi:hypothetical protein